MRKGGCRQVQNLEDIQNTGGNPEMPGGEPGSGIINRESGGESQNTDPQDTEHRDPEPQGTELQGTKPQDPEPLDSEPQETGHQEAGSQDTTEPKPAESGTRQPEDAGPQNTEPEGTGPDEDFDEEKYLKDLKEKRIQSRRRRQKQMRTLWFILFVTIVLSVTTIIYVETRLSGVISGREKANRTVQDASGTREQELSDSGAADKKAESGETGTGKKGTGKTGTLMSGQTGAAEETSSSEKADASPAVSSSDGNPVPDSAGEAGNEKEKDEKPDDADTGSGDAAAEEETAAAPVSGESHEVRLTAAGDNLIHQRLYEQAAARSGDGTYDFSFAYDSVKSFLQEHDLNWVDVETLINNEIAPSGYPEFSTPGRDGEALLQAGFNVFSLASNHTYDYGAEGIAATLNFWTQTLPERTAVTGIWSDEGLEDIPVITTEQGYVIAFLTYVDFTNAEPDENMPGRVIYLSETELIENQIRLADELADAVVVSCHWGEEGSHDITEEQRVTAQQIADWGADVIIGDHPHVVQDAEWITAQDGRQVFCVYSLGNFVSTQEKPDELIGVIMELTLSFPEDDAEGTMEIKDPLLVPVVTVYGEDGTDSHVVFYHDLTDEDIGQHGVRKEYPEFDRDYIENVLRTNVTAVFLDLPEKPEETTSGSSSAEKDAEDKKEVSQKEESSASGPSEEEAGSSSTSAEETGSSSTSAEEGANSSTPAEKAGKNRPAEEPRNESTGTAEEKPVQAA